MWFVSIENALCWFLNELYTLYTHNIELKYSVIIILIYVYCWTYLGLQLCTPGVYSIQMDQSLYIYRIHITQFPNIITPLLSGNVMLYNNTRMKTWTYIYIYILLYTRPTHATPFGSRFIAKVVGTYIHSFEINETPHGFRIAPDSQ